MYSDENLRIFAKYLEEYAEDWDEKFRKNGNFFTQEYWYLLVNVTEAYWDKKPLHLAAAKAKIKGLDGGDDRTKQARIDAAEEAGLVFRLSYEELDPDMQAEVGRADKRKTFILPTAMLENKMRQHLDGTLRKAIAMLATIPKTECVL